MESLIDKFIIPEDYIGDAPAPCNGFASRNICSARGWLLLVPGNSGMDFAKSIKEEYEAQLKNRGSRFTNVPFALNEDAKTPAEGYLTEYFSDGELQSTLPFNVRGSAAYVVQNVHNPRYPKDLHANLFETFVLCKALKLHGARYVTAVLPYLPYSRGDKPTYQERQISTAKLVADFMRVSLIDGVLLGQPHTDALRAVYDPIAFTPIDQNDFVYSVLKQYRGRDDVAIVTPDVSAAKSLRYIAEDLGLRLAIIDKFRDKQGNVGSVGGLLNSLEGIVLAIMIDDETASGSTFVQGGKFVRKEEERLKTKIDKIGIVAHNKLPRDKLRVFETLKQLGFVKFITTNTVPVIDEVCESPIHEHYSMAKRFAFAINHLFYDVSGSALFWPKAKKEIFDDRPIERAY
jgi:ribose-phosphate pyrophosphokinase